MRIDNQNVARWRGHVFLAAWTLYAGYYICRKDLASSTGSGVSRIAVTLACFAITYAAGQFIGGELADRFGARRTALGGAGLSIACTCALAWCTQPQLALLLQSGNGLGQGFGWPSLLKLIGSWFREGERDRVLGWWSTSYILGGLLATSLTAWLVVHTGVVSHAAFYPAYLVSAGVLLCAALFFYRETSDSPAAAPFQSDAPSQEFSSIDSVCAWRSIAANHTIRIISAAYFFLKMTRYTLLFWLPHYLVASMGYSSRAAVHIASCFEFFGFLGPLAAGYAVQKWWNGKRMALAAGVLFGLAFLCLVHPVLAGNGWFALCFSISLMGILICGADILISGMAVLDAMPAELHGRATGFVNGIGSVGQFLSPFLITIFVSHLGWTKLFDLFVFFAIVAGIVCVAGARKRQQTSALNRSALEPSNQFP